MSISRTLFWIKLVHSLVFLVESAAILYIFYSGLFDVSGPGLMLAILLVLAEAVVYLGNGQKCPMTAAAQRLGDVHGDDLIADIFLPHWFALMIPKLCGGLFAVGLVMVLWRLLI